VVRRHSYSVGRISKAIHKVATLCAISEAGGDAANGGGAVIGHDGDEDMRVSGIEKDLVLLLYD
jgi:hypothetical protein